jgi:serine/threonine protein kinase
MITNLGDVYLIDFDIARRYQAEQSKDTGQLGSPGYAAPEQYRKTQTTPLTDIYGLGATLQTLLTGKEPLDIQLNGIPPDCKIPKEVQALLTHMMERDASKRPTSMEAIAQSLQSLTEHFASIKKPASKLESPFLWLAALWILLINVIISTFYQLPFLALFFLPTVVICIYALYKEKRKITGKLTMKQVGATLNKVVASRFILITTLLIYYIPFSVFHRASSSFPLPLYMFIIGLYIAQFGGAFAILWGLQPLLTWLQKIKVARQNQPPAQPEVAQLQQQSRKNSI